MSTVSLITLLHKIETETDCTRYKATCVLHYTHKNQQKQVPVETVEMTPEDALCIRIPFPIE